MASKDKPGFYKGKHYTKYVDEVKSLMRDNRLDDAERLLLELVNATEAEARSEGFGVAPWYYERLAVLYRKKKNKDAEIAILERYLERYSEHKHNSCIKPPLLTRLEKLKK